MQPAVDDLRQAEELSDDIFARIEPAVSDRGHGSMYRDEAKSFLWRDRVSSSLRRKVLGDPDHLWVKPLA